MKPSLDERAARLRHLVTRASSDTDLVFYRARPSRLALGRSRLFRRFYLATSSAFGREARVVTAGIAAKNSTEARANDAYHGARRAVHRLEKGLISRPRRAVFGREYAPELVSSLERYGQQWADTDPTGTAWFTDVLEDYFEAIDTTNEPTLAEARRRFESLRHNSGHATGPADLDRGPRAAHRRVPTPATLRTTTNVTIDDLLALATRRRSVRWFADRPVPRDALDRAIQVGTLAPSACNRQPFSFYVADEPERASALGALAMGTAGFAHQFPCCIAVVGDLGTLREVRDRHLPYIDASLAVMGFLFALESQGLAACTVNWPDIGVRDRQIRDFLDLRPEQQTIMLIAVGYPAPDGGVPNSTKKPLDLVRRYIDD